MKRKSGYTFSLTKHLLLKEIWLNPGISRVELARRLDVNKSTITTSISELEQIGIIRSLTPGQVGPKGGRKPIGLEINSAFGFMLGLELRTDKYIAVGISFNGDILFSEHGVLDWKNTSVPGMLKRTLKNLESRIQNTPLPLLGISLGLPGTINPETGMVYYSGPLEIEDPVDLSDLSSHTGGIPVMIENDGNCCAWGELVFRKDECPDNFLFIMGELRPHEARRKKGLIPAIGLGLVLHRKIQYGENHTSGEFQSVFHTPGYLNSFSITDDTAAKLKKEPALMEQVIRELARNIALIVNILNLKGVILGGSFEDYKEVTESIFLEEFARNWPTPVPVQRVILFSRLKEDAVAFGAAAMFVEKMFSIPQQPSSPGIAFRDPLEEILNRVRSKNI